MENKNSPNNIGFLAQCSAESEHYSLQPLLQPGNSNQDYGIPQQCRRSSPTDLTDENRGNQQRTPIEASPSETTHLGDGLQRTDTPVQNNEQLFEALRHRDAEDIERVIQAGADPNATWGKDRVSACHLAAIRSDDTLSILHEYGAEKHRVDRPCPTPLHLAAWAGNISQIGILLGLSKDIQNRLETGDIMAAEDEIRKLSEKFEGFVNVKCEFRTGHSQLPSDSKDDTNHNGGGVDTNLPVLQPGWTALHAASARAHHRCARLLLAAGADACAQDRVGRTPLDIAGCAFYSNHNIDCHDFTELVTILINANCNNFSSQARQTSESPLHTAVELGNLEAAALLVAAGVPVNWLNQSGQTALHLCVEKKLSELLQTLASHGADVKNKNGQTVLHKAVLEMWEPGVSIAIENGADVTARDNKNETPLHLAATTGNVDILNHIINAATQNNIIDSTNSQGETALVKAVVNEHLEVVKRLLEQGASITETLSNQMNLFHITAEKGYLEILTVLLDHDYSITRKMINSLTMNDKKGYGPIHFAVKNNHIECVRILLAQNADVKLETTEEHKGSTPLHLAAIYNRVDIAKIIIDNNGDTVKHKNGMGWTPLHTASRFGNRDMIKLLLKKGADLASRTNDSITAINMIMDHLLKPTEFMNTVFDTCISTNDLCLQDANCKVTVDYSILKPVRHDENMKVIVALLQTGNQYGQRQLLIHPLIESFLHIIWEDTPILLLFLVLTTIYYFFLIGFTLYIMVMFLTKDIINYSPRHYIWSAVLFIGIVLVVLQETLYMRIKYRYSRQIESWVRFLFVGTGLLVLFDTTTGLAGEDWLTHVASLVILLAWLDMTFLQYHFHDYGYYVFMMEKMTANILKVLFTFIFLIIAFCIIFMMQFKFQHPFDGPFSALVKVVAMMFSELDYENIMKENESEKFAKSLIILRITVFVFVIFSTIVTLIASASVIDPQRVRQLVRIRIIKKRIEFLGSLELFTQMKFVQKIMPKFVAKILKAKERNFGKYILSPSVAKCHRAVPCSIRESICAIAELQNKNTHQSMTE